jgi:hypothetical protein
MGGSHARGTGDRYDPSASHAPRLAAGALLPRTRMEINMATRPIYALAALVAASVFLGPEAKAAPSFPLYPGARFIPPSPRTPGVRPASASKRSIRRSDLRTSIS